MTHMGYRVQPGNLTVKHGRHASDRDWEVETQQYFYSKLSDNNGSQEDKDFKTASLLRAQNQSQQKTEHA